MSTLQQPRRTGSGPTRNTRQRRAVLEVLDRQADFHSAQQLHRIVASHGYRVSLATVYRILQGLAATGGVEILHDDEGQALYRRCPETEHHHHLVCRVCGRAEDLPSAAVEAWARSMAEAHGFTATHHVVELTGLCPQCTAAQAAASETAGS